MDRIRHFSAFQGVMMSADNMHSFFSLSSKGGNEEKVKYIIEKLRNFLTEKNYITDNGIVEENRNEYRKLAFCIALNSDLPILNQFIEVEGIDMVICMIPVIRGYLMCEMFWNLHMDQFMYEIIVFCCPHMALQFADAFLTHMKYFNPVEDLDRVRLMSVALYRLICRLHFYIDGHDPDLLTAALNSFQICLNNFTNPPNCEKITELPRDDQYKYLGKSLSSMLQVLEECLNLFSSVQDFNDDDFDPIYLTTTDAEGFLTKTLNFRICDSPNAGILECLNKCHKFLLDDCTTEVMSVSVDIFCAWSEFEENGKTMQQSIGERCSKMHSLLVKLNFSDHRLVAMLKQISREPTKPKDLINDTDVETIIQKIYARDNESAAWVHALIHRHDIHSNKELLVLFQANLFILDEERNLEIFHTITGYLGDDKEDSNLSTDEKECRELLKKLVIRAFWHCHLSVKYSIISDLFNDCLHNKLESEELDDMMTKIFNKLISTEDFDPSDILTVFFQNPRKVFTKVLKLSAENSKQMGIMLNAMECLKKYCNHYYKSDTEPCVIKVIHEILNDGLDTDAKRNHFVIFLQKLKHFEIISSNKLLVMIIMPHLHKALLDKDIVKMKVQVELLMQAFPVSELVPDLRAPTLAMLAQVMECVRWKFTNFNPAMPSTLDLVLQLQTDIFKTYGTDIPEKELVWLRSRVKHLRPINKHYFRRLWSEQDEEWRQCRVEKDANDDLLQSVTGLRLLNAPSDQVIAMLLQVVASLSSREFLDLYSALVVGETARVGDEAKDAAERGRLALSRALQKIHDTLLLLASAEQHHRTDATLGCLLNCYRNYTLVVKNKFFEDPPTVNQVMIVIRKIVRIVNYLDEKCTEGLTTVFMPLLAYIAEKRSECTSDIVRCVREVNIRQTFAAALAPLFPGTV